MYLSPIGPTEIYPKKRRRLPSKPTARSSGTMSAEKTSSPFRHCGLKTTNAHNPQALPGSDASPTEALAVEDRMKLASFDEL